MFVFCYNILCSFCVIIYFALLMHVCFCSVFKWFLGCIIIFLPCGFFFYLCSFFLASSQRLHIGCLPYFYTWCGPSADLECRSQMCCMRLAGNAGPKNSPLSTIAQLCRALSSQLRHVPPIGKKLLNSNISSTCPHNMVNFSPLAAEICWRVWGTPAYFNGFRILAPLLHEQSLQVSVISDLNHI